jgi:hypothetical protein
MAQDKHSNDNYQLVLATPPLARIHLVTVLAGT